MTSLRRVLLLSALFACAWAQGVRAEASLDGMLKPFLEGYRLPALAAAVVRDGRVVAAGAVGTRRAGADIPVTLNDRFHIGSDTKAMTALLAAMLVEAGRLKWDSTPAEVFPELAPRMNPGFAGVTLTQLLSHTSGIPADNAAFGELADRAGSREGNLDEMRYWMLEQAAAMPLEAEPGTRFAYSNLGYTLAGAMIERAAGEGTWDELVTGRVFAPLGLTTAGLGPQSSLGRVDAPLGHAEEQGRIKAYLAGPNGDNPPLIGPAGIAHMSVLDFARWAGWNAGEGRRGPPLVSAATLKKLHTPVVSMPSKPDAAPGTPSHGRYALGWGEVDVEWAPRTLLYHGGSNTKNLAHIWVDPQQDFAMVIMTNIAGAKAQQALYEIAPLLYRQFAVPATVPGR